MKYTIRKSLINVLGQLWMPSVAGALVIEASTHDVENMRDDEGKITRESVGLWLDSHAGDFSGVIDFSVSIEDGEATIDIPFSSEENEMTFGDCMYGSEE
jgi:hypothetical protein